MAANEYYQTGSHAAHDNNSTKYPPASSPAPTYYSTYHPTNGPKPATDHDRPSHGQAVSPFDTPFDDHVYPLDSRQGAHQEHQSYPTTAYNNDHGRMSTDDRHNDGIPLQDRPHKGAESPDHVYDAGAALNAQQQQKPRRGVLRLGELGMLGSGKKRIPIVVYLFTLVQIAVFIGEIVKNSTTTGSPIMTRPTFNPMIGPSTYVLINMGARFVPCMHNDTRIPANIQQWPCPNTTTNDARCTLGELCGFGAQASNANPGQWFRFIIPMFLHAGIIHIGFNMLIQLTIGREMEKIIGSIRFFLVYVSSGIFGFVLGGNYAATGVASTGASGALFGIFALTVLDLLYSWKERRRPVRDLLFIILEILVCFVLGLLPGLDNFSHIGGFLMGLCLGICVLHSPNALRRRIGEDSFGPSYTSMGQGFAGTGTQPAFFRNPIGFFKGRKALWWVWWLIRAGALLLVIIVFIVLLNNFYVYQKTCDWCKYLSCLPINNWCELGNLQVTQQTTRRDVLQSWEEIRKLYS